jgi:hypothetical protein
MLPIATGEAGVTTGVPEFGCLWLHVQQSVRGLNTIEAFEFSLAEYMLG